MRMRIPRGNGHDAGEIGRWTAAETGRQGSGAPGGFSSRPGRRGHLVLRPVLRAPGVDSQPGIVAPPGQAEQGRGALPRFARRLRRTGPRVELTSPPPAAPCLSCRERAAQCRGLCVPCYNRLAVAVRRGETTWAALEAAGRAL